ncbi:MAG: phosphatase PAP2 family protein [Pyrinomonadaceae bacterium]|nr:phosphatase PAP2 family protein [Pyrinomonadaceae bacterium]
MSVLHLSVKNHFHANAVVGWHLVAGLLVFATMTLIVGEMGEQISNGEPLTHVDLRLTAWLTAHRFPALTTTLWLATALGSTWVASCAAVCAGLYLLWRRQPYWFTAVWLAVFGGMGLNRLLKYTFQRPRPYFDDPILSLTGYSFPSGHTMTATVLYAVLAAYLVAHTKRLGWRVVIVLAASVLIATVGFSRIYLGAHYLSDVLGALAEGLAWLSLCLTTVYTVWRLRNQD